MLEALKTAVVVEPLKTAVVSPSYISQFVPKNGEAGISFSAYCEPTKSQLKKNGRSYE